MVDWALNPTIYLPTYLLTNLSSPPPLPAPPSLSPSLEVFLLSFSPLLLSVKLVEALLSRVSVERQTLNNIQSLCRGDEVMQWAYKAQTCFLFHLVACLSHQADSFRDEIWRFGLRHAELFDVAFNGGLIGGAHHQVRATVVKSAPSWDRRECTLRAPLSGTFLLEGRMS